jgi:hypothetical protein
MADSILVHNLRFLIFLKHFPIEYIRDPMRGESEEEGNGKASGKRKHTTAGGSFPVGFLARVGTLLSSSSSIVSCSLLSLSTHSKRRLTQRFRIVSKRPDRCCCG